MKRTLPLLTALVLAPLAALRAAEPWWREYTPVATVGLRAESLETIQPGAARGVGTLGWYGFWFLDSQEKAGYSPGTPQSADFVNRFIRAHAPV